jgi:hypothetical protein
MELDVSMAHIVRGVLMVGATGVIQVVAQLALSHILLIGHLLQVTMWAALYYNAWGKFGSFGNALYSSLASFTTLGATELALPPVHRMVGAFESAAGMMMFGWSTALLVAVVQRTDRRQRS